MLYSGIPSYMQSFVTLFALTRKADDKRGYSVRTPGSRARRAWKRSRGGKVKKKQQ